MSSSDSDSERSSSSGSFPADLSDFVYEYEETRTEARKRQASSSFDLLDDVDEGAYQDEPIASQEWLDDYNQRQKATAELESELKKRLSGEVLVSDWCKCGKCELGKLENISECYCCTELDGCVESLNSDLVKAEVSSDVRLVCVTDHPGFQPVCLQKWSLRMAADRFKTKAKKRYRQTGSEGRFFRSIAYREFSRLIYGMLGSKRILLPSCAYNAVRNTFPLSETGETFTGFDMNEDS